MGSNFKDNFDGDCFRELKRDFNRLIRNLKRNRLRRCIFNNCYVRNALKWGAVGGILTFLIISQIGIPLAFILIAIIAIAVICSKF